MATLPRSSVESGAGATPLLLSAFTSQPAARYGYGQKNLSSPAKPSPVNAPDEISPARATDSDSTKQVLFREDAVAPTRKPQWEGFSVIDYTLRIRTRYRSQPKSEDIG